MSEETPADKIYLLFLKTIKNGDCAVFLVFTVNFLGKKRGFGTVFGKKLRQCARKQGRQRRRDEKFFLTSGSEGSTMVKSAFRQIKGGN